MRTTSALEERRDDAIEFVQQIGSQDTRLHVKTGARRWPRFDADG
jgi:hypothetical protein